MNDAMSLSELQLFLIYPADLRAYIAREKDGVQ